MWTNLRSMKVAPRFGMTRFISLKAFTGLLMCLAPVLFASPSAHADALPPDQADCAGAEEGDRCPGGRCERTKCLRPVKSPDASAPISSTEVDCLLCVEHDDGGCSADPGGVPGAFGPWLLAGSVALLVMRRRCER